MIDRAEVERRMQQVAKPLDSGFLLTVNAAVSVALALVQEARLEQVDDDWAALYEDAMKGGTWNERMDNVLNGERDRLRREVEEKPENQEV